MNRKVIKEEDSGSDWDSMSEIAPPPSTKQAPQFSPQDAQPATIQTNDRFVARVNSSVDLKTEKDNPPYDFKAEVTSPLHVTADPPKPGKHKKGRTYDPVIGGQKHVTFAGGHGGGHGPRIGVGGPVNPDSDSEDPLYSTVKPKHKLKGNNLQTTTPPPESDRNEIVHKPKKTTRNTAKFSQSPLEGIDNHGYVEDRILHSEEPSVLNDGPRGSQTRVPQITLKAPLSKLTENVNDYDMATNNHASHLIENNITFAKECSPPMILTTKEAVLESAGRRPVQAVNRALGEAFALVTLPLNFFTIFLHHLLRFILQGLIRPICVDSLRLVIEYLVQPFITGVMKPLLATVHVASVSLSDTMLVCVRPLTRVLQSVRLVEVHYTSRYSVEEI